MTTWNERLQAALKARSKTDADLVRATGRKASSVHEWLGKSDSKPPTKMLGADNAAAICRFLRINLDWLIYGRGPSGLEDQIPEAQEETVFIYQYDTGGAMGVGGLVLQDQPGEILSWSVTREWIRSNIKGHVSSKDLCIVTGFGDSMRPDFNPGDPLLIDRSVTSVDHDGFYFFRVGEEGFIKRIQRVPGVGMRAISSNPAYEPWTITPDMDFEVLGKVVRVWKGEYY